MEIGNVVQILAFFRNIENEITLCRRIIEGFEAQYYTVGEAVNYDEPVVKPGTTSDPTARLALRLPDSVAPSCRQLEEYINELAVLKAEIFAELGKLAYIEKAVIYAFYIERMTWTRIMAREHYGRETCKRNRNRGLEKLQRYFHDNAVIGSFFRQKR